MTEEQKEKFMHDLEKNAVIHKNYEYMIPSSVNEYLNIIQESLQIPKDTANIFEWISDTDCKNFRMVKNSLFELDQKYSFANKTKSFLKQKPAFVLYLHDFAMKVTEYEHGTVTQSNTMILKNAFKISEKINSYPIVSLIEPSLGVEIYDFLLQELNTNAKNVYLVHGGVDWLEKVKLLSENASAIIFDIGELSSGVQKELELVSGDSNLLSKTFFINWSEKENLLDDLKVLVKNFDNEKVIYSDFIKLIDFISIMKKQSKMNL